VITLDFDDTVADRASAPAAFLEFFCEIIECRGRKWQAGYYGYAFAPTPLGFSPNADHRLFAA
jgi:hypothetical protein